MESRYGKNLLAIVFGMVLVSGLMVSEAFAWGYATHA